MSSWLVPRRRGGQELVACVDVDALVRSCHPICRTFRRDSTRIRDSLHERCILGTLLWLLWCSPLVRGRRDLGQPPDSSRSPTNCFLGSGPHFHLRTPYISALSRSTRQYDVVVITRVLLNTCSVSDARKIFRKISQNHRDGLALLLRKCFLGLVCLISSFQRTLARGRLISEVSERLVGSPAFKAGGMGEPRPAGSIPVHLRQVCPFQ